MRRWLQAPPLQVINDIRHCIPSQLISFSLLNSLLSFYLPFPIPFFITVFSVYLLCLPYLFFNYTTSTSILHPPHLIDLPFFPLGFLVDGRLKELLPAMPVIYMKAVTVQPTWEPSSVGYLRRVADIYECPVYLTSFRGHTYIFLATLKTIDPCNKWVLTGTAILMQTD